MGSALAAPATYWRTGNINPRLEIDVLNPHLDQWNIWHISSPETPQLDVPLFILIEHDVIEEDILANQPFVRHASLHRYDREPRILYWKLLDFDPENEEEILQQCFSVIAWRYASKVLVS